MFANKAKSLFANKASQEQRGRASAQPRPSCACCRSCRRLSFREIGERLFLSRNTVATEVGSIYRKLGVSSRRAAVERATQVRLLGG